MHTDSRLSPADLMTTCRQLRAPGTLRFNHFFPKADYLRHQPRPRVFCSAATMAEAKPEGITLYSAGTPNGWKASVTFEELGVPYNLHPINLGNGESKAEWYVKINPNGRIPAIGSHTPKPVPLRVW